MNQIMDFIQYFKNTVLAITPIDVIDIALVSVIIYYAVKFIRDKRAAKLLVGVAFLAAFYVMSDIFKMHTLQFILDTLFQVGIISVIIVFQPELRSMLEKVGGTSLNPINRLVDQKTQGRSVKTVETVARAAAFFSSTQTGALIIFERTTKLGDIIKQGVSIKASEISVPLLKNLFYNKAPLHDGAVVISGNILEAAGCLLPLSNNDDALRELGTRHRAGLGISENSDALVVIVSEESGTISVAVDGKLTRHFNYTTLKEELTKYLVNTVSAKKTVAGKKEKTV